MKELKEDIREIVKNLKKVEADIQRIQIDLTKDILISEQNKLDLKEHIKRTYLLEGRMSKVEIPIRIIGYLGVPLSIVFMVVMILNAIKII